MRSDNTWHIYLQRVNIEVVLVRASVWREDNIRLVLHYNYKRGQIERIQSHLHNTHTYYIRIFRQL